MGHACEWETSMVLRAAPHLVGDYRAAADIPQGEHFAPGFRAWTTRDRTAAGHIGRPSAASAEKGEALLNHFADGIDAWLERVLAWNGEAWNA
jgi:creatinine amidohydrolase